MYANDVCNVRFHSTMSSPMNIFIEFDSYSGGGGSRASSLFFRIRILCIHTEHNNRAEKEATCGPATPPRRRRPYANVHFSQIGTVCLVGKVFHCMQTVAVWPLMSEDKVDDDDDDDGGVGDA